MDRYVDIIKKCIENTAGDSPAKIWDLPSAPQVHVVMVGENKSTVIYETTKSVHTAHHSRGLDGGMFDDDMLVAEIDSYGDVRRASMYHGPYPAKSIDPFEADTLIDAMTSCDSEMSVVFEFVSKDMFEETYRAIQEYVESS